MIRRSLAFSFLQGYSVNLIRIVSMVVMARLLAPVDYGLYASAGAILGILGILSDFGLATYIIQERDLTQARLRTAFGLSLVTNWSVAALLASALLLFPQEGTARTTAICIAVMGLNLVVSPFAMPILARLQRDMRFNVLLWVGLSKAVLGVLVGVWLALAGFGAVSLACAMAAEGMTAAAMALWYSRRLPLPRPGFSEWRHVIRFGWLSTIVGGLRPTTASLSILIATSVLGAAASGILTRALRIGELFDQAVMQAVNPIVLPALGSFVRNGRDLRQPYLDKVTYQSGIAWPFFGFVAINAHPLTIMLLGQQWEAVVPIVRILCISGIFLPFSDLHYQFFVALDMLNAYVWRQALTQAIRIAIAGVAAFLSLELFALSFVADVALRGLLTQGMLQRRLNFGLSDLVRCSTGSAVVALGSLAGPVAFAAYGERPSGAFLQLAASGALAGTGWLLAAWLVRHPLWAELAAAAPKVQSLAARMLSRAPR